MSEFEDKLQSILGDPQAMGQIMALAQSISGGSSAPEPPPDEPPQAQPSETPDALSGLDPRLLRLGTRLLAEYQRTDGRNEALLAALQPFLREPRHAEMDRAIRIARLAHVIRVALDAFREGDAADV